MAEARIPDMPDQSSGSPSSASSMTMRGFGDSEPAFHADDQEKGRACAPAPLTAADSLDPPLLQRRRSLGSRTVGELTVDGLRHSCLTLTSTALGGGLLAVSYVMFQVGIGLGVLMLFIGASMAYLSTVALMRISTEIGHSSYGGLFSYCAGPRAGPILDAMLFIYGNGSCVGYFVFLGDFIPALFKFFLPDSPSWILSRWFGIVLSSGVVLPIALQRELAALRHLTPISIMALVYVAVVIFSRCFYFYDQHAHAADKDEYGELKVIDFNIGLFNAFSICVFAFNCHINVVPVAGRLVRPTKDRIRKVSLWVNALQLAFYTIIGVSGYLSFLDSTEQDILKNFKDNDIFMIVGRILLSFTMIIAIPMNTNPSVRSGLQIRDYFVTTSRWILPTGSPQPSPRASPASSPQASPRVGQGQIITPSLPTSPGSPEAQTASLPSNDPFNGDPEGFVEPALPRIVLTFFCVVVQVLTAIAVPGVADVLSLLGATVATAMMLLIPAYAIGKVLPPTTANRCQQVVLILFACISAASVPVKVLQAAGVV